MNKFLKDNYYLVNPWEFSIVLMMEDEIIAEGLKHYLIREGLRILKSFNLSENAVREEYQNFQEWLETVKESKPLVVILQSYQGQDVLMGEMLKISNPDLILVAYQGLSGLTPKSPIFAGFLQGNHQIGLDLRTLMTQELREKKSAYFFKISGNEKYIKLVKTVALSPTEKVIVDLLSKGMSSQEIAEMRQVSVSAVNKHIMNILNKFCLESRNKLLVVAFRGGLVS